MNLRQRQLALGFALCSGLITACGSDAVKGGGPDTGSAGEASESAGAPAGGDVGNDGSAGAKTGSGGNHATGGAPAAGGKGSGTGTKTGIVKLNLKVK